MAITKNKVDPPIDEYKDVKDFEITKSGSYYVWIRDKKGNVSCSEVIKILPDVIFDGAKVNGVEYNGVKINHIYCNGVRFRL